MEFAAIVVRPEEWGAEVPVVEGGSCLPIIWPGMGAVERSLHQFRLPAGASTVDLRHPVEAVYYVVEGEVEVTDLDEGSTTTLGLGAMFHVEPDTGYRFASAGGDCVVLGGPCPADPVLYAGMTAGR